MFYKVCSECNEESWTEIIPNKWTCPYCGEDITDIEYTESPSQIYTDNLSIGTDRDVDSDCDTGVCPVR